MLGSLLIACRRAWKAGRSSVGTEHVFGVIASDLPALKAELRPEASALKARIADRRGWRSDDGGSGGPGGAGRVEGEAAAVLREAAYLPRLGRRGSQEEVAPEWTGGVRAAVVRALLDAQSRWMRHANSAHLVVGLCQDPDSRAVELLAEVGVSADRVLASLSPRLLGREGTPSSSAVIMLDLFGMLSWCSAIRRVLSGVVRADTGGWRPGGFKPIVAPLDAEAGRLAARRGAARRTQADYLLAIRLLPDQLAERRVWLADRWAAHNDAGQLLSQHGVTGAALAELIGQAAVDEPPAAGRTRRWRHRNPASLPFGAGAVAADERAHAYASELGHPYAGTDHLLMALLEAPEGAVGRLLADLGVDTGALARDLAGQLGLDRRRP